MAEHSGGMRSTSGRQSSRPNAIKRAPPARPSPCLIEAIYLRERAGLVRYLGRRVAPDIAADIAQEVFVRIASSDHIVHVDNHGGYLCRIAQNILIDRARWYRRRTPSLPLREARDVPSAADQAHGLEAGDLRRTVDRALAGLPEQTRRVFLMHRVEEMAHRDIHRALGISVATVEYHMGRALAQIRSAIAATE